MWLLLHHHSIMPMLCCFQVNDHWSVAGRMWHVPGPYIAVALLPALIISILFYFDHNVSSQLAQQTDFNLRKPPAYHYDFLLLAALVRPQQQQQQQLVAQHDLCGNGTSASVPLAMA
eukprot:GHUV01040975.1.p2 GENE.GHUV01040975.1~~GHUV01040975.1.p2  ORF type:complete len:117 (+),score=56.16 GHUV01040975.1:919-1269(+)